MIKWSKKFDKCRNCKTVSDKHYRYGYCYYCYNKSPEKKASTNKYYSNNKEKRYLQQVKYKKNNRDTILKKQREYRKGLYQRMTVIKCAHSKRNEGRSDITTTFLVDMWRSTTKCSLCYKKLENNSSHPKGKHLDHIYPLNGGTSCGLNVRRNVRFVCGLCNTTRGLS